MQREVTTTTRHDVSCSWRQHILLCFFVLHVLCCPSPHRSGVGSMVGMLWLLLLDSDGGMLFLLLLMSLVALLLMFDEVSLLSLYVDGGVVQLLLLVVVINDGCGTAA